MGSDLGCTGGGRGGNGVPCIVSFCMHLLTWRFAHIFAFNAAVPQGGPDGPTLQTGNTSLRESEVPA